MLMNFIGKTLNPIPTTTPSNPKSILKQQQALVRESLVVDPTLSIGGGLVLSTSDGAHLTTEFNADNGGENIETNSKGKGDGIAKDGSSPSKQC